MNKVGKADLDSRACGFTLTGPDDPTCGAPVAIHALITDTWELVSFAVACAEHAPPLRRIADYTHGIEEPCHNLDARFLVRIDGSSFCYHPQDDADFMARIAQPDIALVGPLA